MRATAGGRRRDGSHSSHLEFAVPSIPSRNAYSEPAFRCSFAFRDPR
jgi:hypothetical protein